MNCTDMDKRILELAEKWKDGTITPEEEIEFASWYNSGQEDSIVVEHDFAEDEQTHRDRILAAVLQGDHKTRRPFLKTTFIAIFRIAATILVFLGLGIYFFNNRYEEAAQVAEAIVPVKGDVLPGGSRATLTLADGKKIRLDEVGNGRLALQAGIVIRKSTDGKIIYDISGSSVAGGNHDGEFNTIETPVGGEYQVNLPDGSRVWLNASSSLRFPVLFANDERRVELSGEAYFEIAKNKLKPFKVISNDMEVRVLGTHFNVMAYSDEQTMNTTLLEGSVNIKSRNGEALLRPGQEAELHKQKGGIKISTVDTDVVIAWKNGYFNFENEDIQSVMKRVSRWYNVEISYEGKIGAPKLGGTFSRNKKISELLNYLEKLGDFHFKIEGRRVTVMQ